jgi:hypothetical protein
MTYKKIIWLDLRLLKNNSIYSNFIYELVFFLINETPEYIYNIYINSNFSNLDFPKNTKIIKSKIKPWSMKDQVFWKKEVKDEEFLIFFDHKIPVNIKKDYILFIPKLTELHFPVKQSFLKNTYNNYLFKESCKNAKEIICFNRKVSEEINDKLNISEENINILPAFFSKYNKKEKLENIPVNIKLKYNVSDNFLIYDSGIWIEKNLEKLIDVFIKIKNSNLDISLVILNETTVKDIDFRKKVIENSLTDKIFFIWDTTNLEQDFLYENTLWVIFPFLYNIFPFEMEKALNYNSNILASDLQPINSILWKKVIYFNPNNISDIYNKIIKLEISKNNYEEIFENNKIDKTYEGLRKVIESL